MYSWERNECPKCKEPAGSRCRTIKTRRVTDTHAERESYHVIGKSLVQDGR